MLTKLGTAQGLESISRLYEKHIQEFLEKLKVSTQEKTLIHDVFLHCLIFLTALCI